MNRAGMCLPCLVAACWLAAAAAQQCRLACSTTNTYNNFDYYYLVRQWPATYCSDSFCSRKPAANSPFTLHGLWPQRRGGGWPSCCRGAALNTNDLQSLRADLSTFWPSYNQPDNCFYKHEWDKHGTCALGSTKDITSPKDYFAATLRLHKQLDIGKALTASGITPSDTKTYSADSIRQALKRAWGAWVNLSCDKEGRLTEIMTCLDKQLGVIDCPLGRPHSQCARVSLPITSSRARYTCNCPGCIERSEPSEQQQVGGKGKACSRCRIARYCCKEHQTLHWRQHKAMCNTLAVQQASAN